MSNVLFADKFTSFPGCFDWAPAESSTYAPPVDVLEQESRYELRLDLPGIAREKLAVHLENGELVVSGERTAERAAGTVGRCERWTGKFERAFKVGDGIDGSRIEATLKDGVLTLVLPKTEATKARQIPIT